MSSVLAELGLDGEVHSPGAATVHAGDVEFRIRQQVERHFLMRIEVAEFEASVPVTGEGGRIELGHRGGRRRAGVTARPRPDRADLQDIADRLLGSEEFHSAFLPLDAKTAVLQVGRDSSRAIIRHVGFSRVLMVFPPTKRYVSAGADQAKALIDTLSVLARFS